MAGDGTILQRIPVPVDPSTWGLAVDSNGAIYTSNTADIRRTTSGGVTSVIGGGQFQPDSGDGGPATATSITGAAGLALDSDGNLYVALRNTANQVKKLIPTTFSTNDCLYSIDSSQQ